MSSPVPPDRCGTADTAKSDDPLDGKPSEDATLTHVDSCSSLPEAGDDLVPSAQGYRSQPNHQSGRNDEFGQDTLIQLLANASTLLTSQDLALPTNDPRVFLPTPFAPGQSARTLLEREIERKKQQENEGWNALQSETTMPSRATVSASTQLQTSPMHQQLPLGRGRPRPDGVGVPPRDPFFQHQPRPQPLLHQQQHLLDLQQQHLLDLQQQLSNGGLLNPPQNNPMQGMFAPTPPFAFQQPHRNDFHMPALGVGVGLSQLGAFGGSSRNAVRNNLMPGLIPGVTNNVASAVSLTANNNGMDTTRLNWLLQQQPYEEEERASVLVAAAATRNQENQEKYKAPKDRTTTGGFARSKRAGRGNSDSSTRPNRWTQRYNELLEFKRTEGVSCFFIFVLNHSLAP